MDMMETYSGENAGKPRTGMGDNQENNAGPTEVDISSYHQPYVPWTLKRLHEESFAWTPFLASGCKETVYSHFQGYKKNKIFINPKKA